MDLETTRPVAGRGVGLWLVVWIGMWGCASDLAPAPSSERESGSKSIEEIATTLLPAGALSGELVLRQRVTVRWGEHEEGFDAVLQKRGEELLLVGLGPMSTVAFSLRLEGDRDVVFENHSGRELPFRPEYILADVQRIFYPWLREASACRLCERRGIRVGLEIHERIGVEHLEQRRFTIPGRPERGELDIRYEDWAGDPAIPRRATLRSGWLGYELVVEVLPIEVEAGNAESR